MVDTASLEKADSLNSDEEYLKIIANDTSDSQHLDDDKRNERIKELTEAYMKDDQDGKKYFALADFLANAGRRGDPFFASVDRPDHGGNNRDEISTLKHRIGNLEATVSTIDTKLDRLCTLLDTSKTSNRSIT